MRTFTVGHATVSVMNVGDITLPLLAAMRAPERRTGESEVVAALHDHRIMPMQDLVIRIGSEVVLVDAGAYDVDSSSSYFVPGYQPPGAIDQQLRSLAVSPDDVTRVVITHRHWDHFNGTAVASSTGMRPTFRNAFHYLGRADWPAIEARLGDPTSRESRSIGVVHAAGHLQLVDGELRLTPEITIHAAPGETPGHLVVRLRSGGESLFAVGDLYHDPVEVSHPGWMVNWADSETNQRSRRWLVREAVSTRATIVASHIRAIGSIVGTADTPRWSDRAD